MHNFIRYGCFFCLCLFFAGCAALTSGPKYQFTDGYYRTGKSHTIAGKNYVVVTDDTIKVYEVTGKQIVDTTRAVLLTLPSANKIIRTKNLRFSQPGLDIDFLSVLFKYRPAVQGFPNQFNTTFNGAVYGGYRSDVYKINYRQNPFGVYHRAVNHYGYSVGLFSGLGSARIDQSVTLNRINFEYDGFVSLSGIAAIVGINKLSIGLTIGADHLLDKYHNLWVNQGKPWIGLSIGLNLN